MDTPIRKVRLFRPTMHLEISDGSNMQMGHPTVNRQRRRGRTGLARHAEGYNPRSQDLSSNLDLV